MKSCGMNAESHLHTEENLLASCYVLGLLPTFENSKICLTGRKERNKSIYLVNSVFSLMARVYNFRVP